MEFQKINDVRARIAKAALSGEENVTVKSGDLSQICLYLAMAEPNSSAVVNVIDVVDAALNVIKGRNDDADIEVGPRSTTTLATTGINEMEKLTEALHLLHSLKVDAMEVSLPTNPKFAFLGLQE